MDPSKRFINFGIENDNYIASPPRDSHTYDYEEGSFVTVFNNGACQGPEEVASLAKAALTSDDVLRVEFLQNVLIVSNAKPHAEIRSGAKVTISWEGGRTITVDSSANLVHAGPYLVSSGKLCPIFKLYEDTQRCFLLSTVPFPGKDRDHVAVPCKRTESGSSFVAVPSRHSVSSDVRHSLAEFRVAIKDAFDIRGFKKTLGSKAYYELYSPASSTAPSIQRLIDRGAQIIGKTKMSMFMSREEPAEAVDYQAPWNPRGDGYQGPGGSSSGSAAAIAAYPWLDIAIGIDTNGSIRRPAQCNGCFGLRISRNMFPTTGMFTIFEHFDVPGALSLDLEKLRKFVAGWYGDDARLIKEKSYPRRIVYLIDDLPPENSLQGNILAKFVERLHGYAETEVEHISLAALWEICPPTAVDGQTLHEFLAEVGATTFLYANYNSMESFQRDYMQANGHAPFVSQFVRWRWDIGAKQTKHNFDIGMQKLDIYKHWLLEHVMKKSTHDTIVVMPSETVKPNYRTDLPSGNYIQPAWHTWWIAPILGAPEMTMPVGQVPYHSSITNETAYLPVNISLLSEQFSDMHLLDFCKEALRLAGLPLSLKTGNVI